VALSFVPTRMRVLPAALAVGLSLVLSAGPLSAQDPSAVVAKVNGKAITEADLKLAEQDIGADMPQVPEPAKRQLLVEYLIETMAFADAAEAQKIDKGPGAEARLAYARRRALRDLYYDSTIRAAVPDADAKKFYDEQVGKLAKDEEVSARHILVEKKELADDLVKKIKAGGDFAALAKEHSKDPGSKVDGGSLGFFGKGQMVPAFEEAAFKLAKGEVSDPVQSQFGWHVIKVDDRRSRQPPSFEQLKERILQSLISQKAQAVATELRGKAKVEILDAELNKAMNGMKPADAPKDAPKKP
jgi:peptidyl-prolyl cis-trans isomerase C